MYNLEMIYNLIIYGRKGGGFISFVRNFAVIVVQSSNRKKRAFFSARLLTAQSENDALISQNELIAD